jgi:hypothetical protein
MDRRGIADGSLVDTASSPTSERRIERILIVDDNADAAAH